MPQTKTAQNDISKLVEAEMIDTFDEELEMELDDTRLEKLLGDLGETDEDGMLVFGGGFISESCSGCKPSSSSCRIGSLRKS